MAVTSSSMSISLSKYSKAMRLCSSRFASALPTATSHRRTTSPESYHTRSVEFDLNAMILMGDSAYGVCSFPRFPESQRGPVLCAFPLTAIGGREYILVLMLRYSRWLIGDRASSSHGLGDLMLSTRHLTWIPNAGSPNLSVRPILWLSDRLTHVLIDVRRSLNRLHGFFVSVPLQQEA